MIIHSQTNPDRRSRQHEQQVSQILNALLRAGEIAQLANGDYALGMNVYVPLTRTISIFGVGYDLSADRSWSGVIASTYGGTGNGFTKFSGPTTTEKTKTVRNADDTIMEVGGSYTPTGTYTSMTQAAPVLSGVVETGVNLTATMSGTVTANYAAGDYQYGTISGSLTLVFSNPPASGSVGTLSLEITGDGTHGITWPTSVDWGTAGAPATLGAGSCTIFTFITRNGGTKWRAAYVGGFA